MIFESMRVKKNIYLFFMGTCGCIFILFPWKGVQTYEKVAIFERDLELMKLYDFHCLKKLMKFSYLGILKEDLKVRSNGECLKV